MNKAVFLDRDGTLVKDKGYMFKPKDLEFNEKVFEGLRLLEKDFLLLVVSNQAGIGRGYFSEKEMHSFNEKMLEGLKKHGIKIKRIYFCPHSPEENCSCRKPKTRMTEKAREDFGLDLHKSYLIGDKESDILLARNSGMKAVLLGEKENLKADFAAENLLEAAEWILSDSRVRELK